MSKNIDTRIIRHEGYEAVINVVYDEAPENPNDWGGPQVQMFWNHGDRDEEAHKIFSDYGVRGIGLQDDEDLCRDRALLALSNGQVLKYKGVYYLGVYEMQHGRRAYYLCDGNQEKLEPTLDGWVSWEEKELWDETARTDPEVLRTCTKQVLEDWGAWVNGDCYGYQIEIMDYTVEDPKLVEEDACYGYLNDLEYCKECAIEAAAAILVGLPGTQPFVVKKWDEYQEE